MDAKWITFLMQSIAWAMFFETFLYSAGLMGLRFVPAVSQTAAGRGGGRP
jgi:hypothetical protein